MYIFISITKKFIFKKWLIMSIELEEKRLNLIIDDLLWNTL